MDKQEAYKILTDELRVFSEADLQDLETKLGSTTTLVRQGSAGTEYKVEFEFVQDAEDPDSIKITGTAITTGQWHFDPLVEQITVKRK